MSHDLRNCKIITVWVFGNGDVETAGADQCNSAQLRKVIKRLQRLEQEWKSAESLTADEQAHNYNADVDAAVRRSQR